MSKQIAITMFGRFIKDRLVCAPKKCLCQFNVDSHSIDIAEVMRNVLDIKHNTYDKICLYDKHTGKKHFSVHTETYNDKQ